LLYKSPLILNLGKYDPGIRSPQVDGMQEELIEPGFFAGCRRVPGEVVGYGRE
jgi:hypothetical protein